MTKIARGVTPRKRAEAAKRAPPRSAAKTTATTASVADFIAAIPQPARCADAQMLLEMIGRITKEPARLWGSSIVGFGSYRYRYESGREGVAPMAAFSPRKAAIVVYIMTGFQEAKALLGRLGKHRTGKSCLYLNALEEIDIGVLEELIARSVAEMRRKYSCD